MGVTGVQRVRAWQDMVLAGMLSRAPLSSQASSAPTDVDFHAVQVVSSIVTTPIKMMAALRANCCKAGTFALPCPGTTRIQVSQ
ncbi:uncharacterized protein LOC119457656 isoform X2 [Dermacentor silvarum]|uniref:uncharacterized protein LOC119457656 isoform X2 n=1 Tax=Dermacentor silvarum TaxID=543639 RepID=UPI0021010DDC|nr:uncharacterized protein LOC119457656 isoform X2 [Dermacentor silvarum]